MDLKLVVSAERRAGIVKRNHGTIFTNYLSWIRLRVSI